MKHTKRIPLLILLLAAIMPASSALAQTTDYQKDDEKTVAEPSPTDGLISAARSSNRSDAKAEDTPRNSHDGLDVNLAQLSQRRPAPGPQRGYRPESYETHWMDRGSGRHALIGAMIGFGVGAALAAKANKGSSPGAAIVLIGGAGALIGAAVGANHGGPGRFAHHRRIDLPAGRESKESDLSANSAGPHSDGRRSDEKPTEPVVPVSSRTLALP
jgi:hypothetical protein